LAVVHRPAYDDWAFPKGKLEPGESLAQAALREVEEETGLVCRILRPLACLAYPDGHGREKAVCYWLMEPVEGEFRAGKEVDAVRWATGTEALGLLTYRGDQILLRAFLSKFATR
jgi:8-oxo-dGTP diphosphatase